MTAESWEWGAQWVQYRTSCMLPTGTLAGDRGRLHEEVKGEGYWELVRAGEGKVGGWRGKGGVGRRRGASGGTGGGWGGSFIYNKGTRTQHSGSFTPFVHSYKNCSTLVLLSLMALEEALIGMGFEVALVRQAVLLHGQDQEAAIQWLVENAPESAAGDGISAELLSMGFDADLIREAIAECGSSLEAAMDYIVSRSAPSASAKAPGLIAELRTMGFPEALVRQAVVACGDSLESALQWLLDRGCASASDDSAPPAKLQKTGSG